MSLGKRVAEINVKSDGDVFYQLWMRSQLEIPSLIPQTISNCQVIGGETGTVGCVLIWNYFHDGKDRVAKTMIVDIDGEKKSVTYKILEGDLMDIYKTMDVNVGVYGDGVNNVVTWTVEYEKLSDDVSDPDSLMDLCREATKEIDTQLLGYV